MLNRMISRNAFKLTCLGFLSSLLIAGLLSCSSETPQHSSKEASLKQLQQLKAELSFNAQRQLIAIDLSERDLADADLPDFSPFVELREFHAIYTSLRGQCLSSLSQCPKLEVLNLYAAPIEDTYLNHLYGAATLKKVNLAGSSVSDKSISIIKSWKNLEELELGDTRFTLEAIEKLHRELPEIEIYPTPSSLPAGL
ncbi:leucine-rich repeat domain-containing protein [Gimesia maris]|uniref:Leucine Rich repeats (2 copies) n=1 Tax=Gimesia maris TaxID=122 RepID=A0ABX5YUV9_9PLAN|nr:hypothetical protein [Gimesia maris]EDL61491.1 hypothetical protein PM8797T_13343 [Gimesia maris DSM 8797]QEG19476.1 Leucine Rich repeats (2 copies) [Gimesia maris]QGQ27678.1 hypothetical protein F1729_02860 [Gimesia maris]